jgi:hypothetical protein
MVALRTTEIGNTHKDRQKEWMKMDVFWVVEE